MGAPTVLYIGSTITAGYSPSGRGRLTVLPTEPSGDLGLAIEALLAAMPGRARQVYVLSTDVWSQAVTVESRSLRRVEKNQISQILAFEAESLSGMSASAARTSVQLLDAGPIETTYWVSQVESSKYIQAADAVAFGGGKMLGLANPAGLPISLAGARSGWARVERWDDATLTVFSAGRGKVAQPFLPDPELESDSPAALAQWLAAQGHEVPANLELLDGRTAEEGTAQYDGGAINLNSEQGLKEFLAAWSRVLRSPKNIPVLRPIREAASAQTKRTLAIAATAAAVLGIAVHRNLSQMKIDNRTAELQQQITELQAPVEAFRSSQDRLNGLTAELASAEAKLVNLEDQLVQYRGQLGIHRTRAASMLKLLGSERPYDLIIDNIDNNGNEIKVSGKCVRPEAIVEYAKALSEKLSILNLSLTVPRREALLLTSDGGPYAFEYVIQDGV